MAHYRPRGPAPVIKWPAQKDEPQVIWEDEHIILLSKEGGWVCGVSSENNEHLYLIPPLENTLEELIGTGVREHLAHFIMLKWGGNPAYPLAHPKAGSSLIWGIAHRLDVDTSGAQLLGKTASGYSHLRKQFRCRKVYKEYVCLVHGHVVQREGVIEKNIAKVAKHDHAYIAEHGQWAKSFYTVLGRYVAQDRDLGAIRHFSLCRLTIVSGRTHQIRIHMSSIGHPLLNEVRYSGSIQPDYALCRRIFLHAWRIGFTDLDGAWQDMRVPLTRDLGRCINQLEAVPLDSPPPCNIAKDSLVGSLPLHRLQSMSPSAGSSPAMKEPERRGRGIDFEARGDTSTSRSLSRGHGSALDVDTEWEGEATDEVQQHVHTIFQSASDDASTRLIRSATRTLDTVNRCGLPDGLTTTAAKQMSRLDGGEMSRVESVGPDIGEAHPDPWEEDNEALAAVLSQITHSANDSGVSRTTAGS